METFEPETIVDHKDHIDLNKRGTVEDGANLSNYPKKYFRAFVHMQKIDAKDSFNQVTNCEVETDNFQNETRVPKRSTQKRKRRKNSQEKWSTMNIEHL